MIQNVALDTETSYERRMIATPSFFLRKEKARRFLGVNDFVSGTGLSRATITRHLAGEIEPSLDQREKYAQFLGYSLNDFEKLWQSQTDEDPEILSILHRQAQVEGIPTVEYLDRLRREAESHSAPDDDGIVPHTGDVVLVDNDKSITRHPAHGEAQPGGSAGTPPPLPPRPRGKQQRTPQRRK